MFKKLLVSLALLATMVAPAFAASRSSTLTWFPLNKISNVAAVVGARVDSGQVFILPLWSTAAAVVDTLEITQAIRPPFNRIDWLGGEGVSVGTGAVANTLLSFTGQTGASFDSVVVIPLMSMDGITWVANTIVGILPTTASDDYLHGVITGIPNTNTTVNWFGIPTFKFVFRSCTEANALLCSAKVGLWIYDD